jgi:hypothetical protein
VNGAKLNGVSYFSEIWGFQSGVTEASDHLGWYTGVIFQWKLKSKTKMSRHFALGSVLFQAVWPLMGTDQSFKLVLLC